MTPFERLHEVFNRAQSVGIDLLSTEEGDLYKIYDFMLEQEMNGLDAYLYNRLPDLQQISSTVDALRKYGLPEMAEILGKALQLFQGYVDPDPPTTWSEDRRRYDPEDRLDDLEDEINALDDFGLANSCIR
jgi:hypothetical protein